MRAELKGLNGGKKYFWLRTHRKEVESYYIQHGPEATMEEFNMRQATLERFFDRKSDEDRINRLSEADRWVLKVANEGIREARRRLSDLENWRVEATPIIAVTQALINATMGQFKAGVESPALPRDTLSLADIAGKLEK